jgi:hypothetical protein
MENAQLCAVFASFRFPRREVFCAFDDLSKSVAARAFLPRDARRREQHVHRLAVHSAENL